MIFGGTTRHIPRCKPPGADGALKDFVLPAQRGRGTTRRSRVVEGASGLAASFSAAPPPTMLRMVPFPAAPGRISGHRKSLRMILPTLLLGNSLTNTITFGTL